MRNLPLMTAWCLIAFVTAAGSSGSANKPVRPPTAKLTRSELIVLKLNAGAGSPGGAISESLRTTRDIIPKIEKALRQIKVADAAFGKSRGKPDDRVLDSPGAHLATAIQTAKQLEEDLVSARDDLKATIETAVAAPVGK
jgi:hypothetical protein